VNAPSGATPSAASLEFFSKRSIERHCSDEARAGSRKLIEALEEDLGRPVLTANQVTFWSALRHAGVRAPVAHYGRIFVELLPRD
jgi:hypothetical protein